MSNHGDVLNSKTISLTSSRTIQYAKRLAGTRTSPYTAQTPTAHQLSPTNRFSNYSSGSRQTTETSDLLLTPWPRNSKISPATSVSSWDFSLTPTASIAAMRPSPRHSYLPPLPNDHTLHPTNTQMTYSTTESTQAPLSYQPSSMISGTAISPDDSVHFLGSSNNTSSRYYREAGTQTLPSLPPPLPLHWLVIAPLPTHSVLVLPPPGYTLWVPISQRPGLTFFKPSDNNPKDGVIEASPLPSNWQYRTAIQREHWVEMTIFEKIPIIRKNHTRWLCGLKNCKWTTKGNLWPTIATEYLVHQFEVHECWWSRSDEGSVHLDRLKRSLHAA